MVPVSMTGESPAHRLTRTSLVLGGLSTPLVISPRPCTAGMTGRNWLTAATIGPLKRA
jgi:hypothetical protein